MMSSTFSLPAMYMEYLCVEFACDYLCAFHIDIVRGRYWLSTLLPQIEAYVDYYAQHFKNDPSGKLDMFP